MNEAASHSPVAGGAALSGGDLADLIREFNDVTARLQRSHEQLKSEVARLTKELGEANAQVERSRRLAALGEMAAGIAHEVRNPLGSIRLYAKVLQDDLAPERPRDANVAGKIADAASALDAVVSDVLTFSREFRVAKEPTSCQQLFERALESCRHEGVPFWKHVRVVMRGGDVTLPADAGLLTQALVNIIRNAIEAMSDCPGRDHVIEISAARQESPEGGRVLIAVRDTGPGVSAEVVSRMFNPFFTTRASGTGLGLAIVHRIVDAHGGRIRVVNNRAIGSASGEEHGATVELHLPTGQANPATGADARAGNAGQDSSACNTSDDCDGKRDGERRPELIKHKQTTRGRRKNQRAAA